MLTKITDDFYIDFAWIVHVFRNENTLMIDLSNGDRFTNTETPENINIFFKKLDEWLGGKNAFIERKESEN